MMGFPGAVAQVRRSTLAMAWAALVALGGLAALAAVWLAGTKTGLVVAIGASVGPFLTWAALTAPLAFPFGAYVALVPFDNILNPDGTGTITRLAAIVTGLTLAFYLLRTGKIVRPSPWTFAWLALYAWMTASAFWAIDSAAVFSLLPTAAQLLALYVAIAIFPASRSALAWSVWTTVIGGVLAAGYGAYLFTHGMDVGKGNRLWIMTDAGGYVDPNHFAAALLLPFAITLGTIVYAKKLWHVAIGTIGLIALCEGIVVSASRGAIIGAGAIALYFFVRSERKIRILGIGLIALASGALTTSSLASRFAAAISSGGSGRTDIWSVGIAAIKEYWPIGAGYNNFAFAYDKAFMQASQLHFMNWHRAPHNLLLDAIVELGVPGLIMLLVAWFGQLRILSDVPKGDGLYPLRLSLEAAIVGTFIAAMFLDVMVMKYLWLTFMLTAILRNAHRAVWRPEHG